MSSTTVVTLLVVGLLPATGHAAPTFTYTRLNKPPRTVVTDPQGAWVATFTDGARTVTVAGPERTFAEPMATSVISTTWVRILPAPFAGAVDEAWLNARLVDSTPDVLALAMQYLVGAPDILDETGLRIAGDADYGPLVNGERQEGSDFNDYLGVPWTYGDIVDQPEVAQYGSLDCSGYTRMVWGYRSGMPLSNAPDGLGIPRRAFEILASAPGVVTIKNKGVQVKNLGKLLPGDLVFFDASIDDGTQIDHVGMFLGLDTSGHYRFISSRKTINGPTMGDTGGKSILDGAGFYATAFRAIRRL
jgi:hypothetical protein